MAEFADNLFAGKDMVTDDDRRWEPGLYGLPRRNGKLKTWSKFDASFFGIPPKQAIYMDPQVRTLLEVAFEAIVDAGLSPASLKGSRTGVFVGSSGSESMPALTRDPDLVSGYSMSGCASAMFANRLSFALDLKGPSFNIDTACNSSLLALQVAMTAMRDGQCTAALVCGSNAVLTPTNALQFLRLGVLSPDGACKSFDAEGSGYAKSEGLGVMLLQRRPAARRLYATLVHAKSNTDGFKDEGVHFPSGATQGALLREVYAECQLSPAAVSYVEAHGTGTKVGDPQEANAIADVFCPKEMERDVLLMGSVKSNMGHAEPASGVASVAKVILCMEQGRIPPNLHFKTPNSAIPALADGRIQMVTEPTLWSGGYVGINSFGFGGANTHVLLRSNPEALPNAVRDDSAIHSPPPTKEEEAALPRLVCYAARTEPGLRKILEEVGGARDDGLDALLAESAQLPTSLYPFRGFALEETSGGQVNIHSQKCEGERRPVWLVFNGMGSQWAGMGRMLAEALPSFRASLEAASAITRPLGIDPLALIADDPNNNTQAFNNVRNIIVANIAIQVALVDLLRELGVEWDGIIGHSTGEIPCGYADKSMTLEQTMHLAFHRGDLLMKAKLPEGAMAAVGLSWEQALAVCKGTEVVAACHNAADSVTLSGPAGAVRKLMDKLSADGVFAREVDCSGVPFHSPLLADLRSQLLARFRQVLPKPAPRGSGWASTSLGTEVEEDKSGLAPAWSGLCSAEYHVNNVLSPVRFFEALSKRVPENAVTVEVGPHALLAAVLRRSLPNGLHIGLMSKRASNSLIHTLSSLGKIYSAGIPIAVQRLYPSQEWPVRRGTPMLGHLIAQSWDHSGDWPVMNGPNAGLSDTGDSSGMTITYDPFDKENDENTYLLDHQIDGRSIFPFTGYPVMAWKALCKIKGLDFLKTPVTFSDLRVFRPTLLTKAGDELHLPVHRVPRHGLEGLVQDQGPGLPQDTRHLLRPPRLPTHSAYQSR